VSRIYTVERHGKRIEVEELDPPKSTRRSRKRGFAQTDLDEAAELAKATGTQSAIVWVLLIYMAWKTKSATFPLPNGLLAQYGVGRWTKNRVLARLEREGKIEVGRHGIASPNRDPTSRTEIGRVSRMVLIRLSGGRRLVEMPAPLASRFAWQRKGHR
jgi:hypothetical protein